MGSSDPLPAGFEIQFGSLNFQATGNGYLMRITNRDELRARRPTGLDTVSVAPTAGAPASAQVDAAGPPAPRRRRRSGQRSQQARTERRRAARIASQRDATTGETATALTGECSVLGPRFPIGLHGATTAYVASSNTDTAARRARPIRHVPAVGNPSASVDDESSYGSASELPPATSHGYAEWDFFGVLDPVMFRRLLDATDYWFGYSDNSSAGSHDPARDCFVVPANKQANAANVAEAGNGEVPPGSGTGPHQDAGPRARPPSPPRGADINTQLAQAHELEAKLAEEYHAVRLLRASIVGEASARRTRARAGQESPRMHQRRLRRRQPEHAPATLMRAMPAPSTPEARNLHREAQALIEQAAVQQAESLASRIRQQGSAQDNRGAQGGTRGRRGRAARQPRAHAGQGADP
jgi:hypothetical protein